MIVVNHTYMVRILRNRMKKGRGFGGVCHELNKTVPKQRLLDDTKWQSISCKRSTNGADKKGSGSIDRV